MFNPIGEKTFWIKLSILNKWKQKKTQPVRKQK